MRKNLHALFDKIKSKKKFSESYRVKAFSFYSFTQGINALINFGILSLYTKLVLPEDFGKISLIWMFIVIVSSLMDSRLNTAFSIKFYKNSKYENTQNIYTILIYNSLLFIIFFVLFSSVPSLFQAVLKIELGAYESTIILTIAILMVISNFFTNLLILRKSPQNYFLAMILFDAILVLSSFVFLIVLKSGYISYLKSYLVSYLIVSIIGLIFIIYHYKPFLQNFISIRNLRDLLRISIPLIPDGLLLLLLAWADRYILNIYCGVAIVGTYSVGYVFASVINNFILIPMGRALTPHLIEQYTKSMEEYKNTIGNIFKFYWIIMSGILLIYFIILKDAYQLLIGKEYIGGYDIIGIISIGLIIGGMSSYLGFTILMNEKTGRIFLFTAITAIFNIGLNFILIPRYNIYGAAIAITLSYVLQFLMILMYSQRLVFIKYDYPYVVKSILISLCFLLSVILLSYSDMNMVVRFGIKLGLFVLFILISYRYLELKDSLMSIMKNVKT
ncbi:MAG: oligosaccharide flippase family protein [Methanothrix sp.]